MSQQIPWGEGNLCWHDDLIGYVWQNHLVLGWGFGAPIIEQTPYVLEESLQWEPDEVTLVGTASALRVELRHSLDRTWAIRIAATNTGTSPLWVTSLPLRCHVAAPWIGWGLLPGAGALVTALPSEVRQPLVHFAVVQGEIRVARTPGQLELGPLRLEPGQTYVVRLRGEQGLSLADINRGRPDIVPAWAWWEEGDQCELSHPDLATVNEQHPAAPSPDSSLTAGDEDEIGHDQTVLIAAAGKSARVQLAGAAGTFDIAAHFAHPLAALLERWIQQRAAEWPRGRQGLLLPSVAEALVVQRLLGLSGSSPVPRDELLDAVEHVCAQEVSDPLGALLLARQAMMTGEKDLALRAVTGWEHAPAQAGTVLVSSELQAALQLCELSEPTLSFAVKKKQMGHPDGLDSELPGSSVGVRCERAILGGLDIATSLYQLGMELGGGLAGERLSGEALAIEAHNVAVLRLAMMISTTRSPGWVCGPAELAARHSRRLRFLIEDALNSNDANWEDVAAALAWLTVSSE